jgi:plastocyanin
MLLSRNEMVAWFIAIVGVAVMGFLAFHGPFNHINKRAVVVGGPVHVQIVTNSQTVGKFVPAKVTVKVDQAVIFTNVSNADHTATEVNDKFDSRNITTGGATWTYIPQKPGTFHYICTYHPFMKGVIVVTK